MIKRYCNICGKEIEKYEVLVFRDSKTQFFKLTRISAEGFEEYGVDICNDCMKEVIDKARVQI